MDQRVVDELREIRPQVFLVEVPMGPKLKPNDPRLVSDLLEVLAILVIDIGRKDLTCHELHPRHVGMFGKRPRQIENVEHLATRVGVPAELGLLASDETVEAE